MNLNKKRFVILVVTLFLIVVFLAPISSEFIDNQYVKNIYPVVSKGLRGLFGKLPFSFGDGLYFLFILTGLLYLIYLVIKIIRMEKPIRKSFFMNMTMYFLFMLSLVIIVFNVLWGFNYHRSSVAQQWGFIVHPYTKQQLEQLNGLLVNQVNTLRAALPDHILHQPLSMEKLSEKTSAAYKKAARAYPFLAYSHPSIKSSLFSMPFSYLGISGYYNPFTGEAQVNTAMPAFLQPFTCCHEVAHQLGYAKENEANWVGFMAALHSSDNSLRYAATFEMMLYANRNLQSIDTASANGYQKKITRAVRNDWKLLIQFAKSHQSVWEPAMDQLYDWFLRSHQQPEGLVTYERVTAWLIAYYKQQGMIQ